MHIMIFQGSPEPAQKSTVAAGGRSNEAVFNEALQSHDASVRTFTLNVADGEKLPQGMSLADLLVASRFAWVDDVAFSQFWLTVSSYFIPLIARRVRVNVAAPHPGLVESVGDGPRVSPIDRKADRWPPFRAL